MPRGFYLNWSHANKPIYFAGLLLHSISEKLTTAFCQPREILVAGFYYKD